MPKREPNDAKPRNRKKKGERAAEPLGAVMKPLDEDAASERVWISCQAAKRRSMRRIIAR
jgi:hypothetical protein